MDTLQLLLLLVGAFFIGASKTGIQGVSMLSIPILAIAFGAKPSTGLILPMLCAADFMAVIYYRSKASWRHIIKLLPSAVLGFFVALLVDNFVPQEEFKILLACSLAIMVVVMLTTKKSDTKLTSSFWYSTMFGLVGGFATMIANAAGPVMAIYLLSMKLDKDNFIGTNAWFFLVINLLKLPLQIFVWNNITLDSLTLNLYALPFILLGAMAGIKVMKYINQALFYKITLYLTIISIILLVAM